MEDEVRQILRQASISEEQAVLKLGSPMAARFKGKGLRTDLPEIRGQAVRPAEFDT